MAKILIIDDNSQLLTMVRTSLEKHGHNVIAAPNATVGLQEAQQQDPDVVLTDLAMPGKDGFSLILDLRSAGFTKPIVATSGGMGTSATDFLDAAKQAGATDTIAKPFTVAELINKINGVLPR